MVACICVIGTSHIGAIYKAYSASGHSDPRIEFFGSRGGEFANISIQSDFIENYRFSNVNDARRLTAYDAFFLHGAFDSPQVMSSRYAGLAERGFSAAVRRQAIIDQIRGNNVFRLGSQIKNMVDCPIYYLSSPVPLNYPPTSQIDYSSAVELIREALGTSTYVPCPAELLDEDYRGLEEYYSNSVDVAGVQHGNPVWDQKHLNEVGGRIVLDSILSIARSAPSR